MVRGHMLSAVAEDKILDAAGHDQIALRIARSDRTEDQAVEAGSATRSVGESDLKISVRPRDRHAARRRTAATVGSPGDDQKASDGSESNQPCATPRDRLHEITIGAPRPTLNRSAT